MATSRGVEGSKKWFGSVSSEASKHSNCPVVLVPPGGNFGEIRNILYPLKSKLEGMDSIMWILEKVHPDLHLVHFDKDVIHSPMIKEILGEHTSILDSKNPWRVVYANDECDAVEQCIADYIQKKELQNV